MKGEWIMNEKKVVKYSKILLVLFIVGVILILCAPGIGEGIGESILSKSGSMDTQRFYMIIEAYTSSFRTVGVVLSLIGGLGTLLSGYVLYKENKDKSTD